MADSLAQELGIQPGDRLLGIDGEPVLDVFDYQIRQLKEQLLITIQQQNGEILEIDLEKDEYEDLGLVFENPLLSECTNCHNRCVFCFIDQLPAGMRRTLYLKDDDMRMSFLHGNYVTLTNISDQELDRLISYRFSPMNISVHATDPEVRKMMMRNRHAGNLFGRLQKLAAAGIELNCQLVLCPGLNDGVVLEKTLTDLASLGDRIRSIAMVPVGITKYRGENGLFQLRPFQPDEAMSVLEIVHKWQEKMLVSNSRRVVYAGDEFYLLADRSFPPAEEYEDYPQLENGVGMAALFIDTIRNYLDNPAENTVRTDYRTATPETPDKSRKLNSESLFKLAAPVSTITVLLVTGTAAAAVLSQFVSALGEMFKLELELCVIKNNFFGETVTVAGLLTGQDLLAQLRQRVHDIDKSGRTAVLVIPECMLKQDEDIFLDDLTLQQLTDQLKSSAIVVPEQAEGLLTGLSVISRINTQGIV
jgi:putative radical SAM enzyme (TIGR03279 family)